MGSPMTLFDIVVLGVVGISAWMGFLRGFFREALALAGWVAAFLVAKVYAVQLAQLLPQAIPGESWRLIAAFVALFMATLLVSSLLAIAVATVFRGVGLGWLDRTLGLLFGLARGVLAVGILVLLAGLTALPQDARWRSAMFSAPLETAVQQVLPWVPQEFSRHVHFD